MATKIRTVTLDRDVVSIPTHYGSEVLCVTHKGELVLRELVEASLGETTLVVHSWPMGTEGPFHRMEYVGYYYMGSELYVVYRE